MAISFKEVFNQSLQDFWSKKVRTIVTVMGIVLGTASIIIVMSIVQGSIKQTTEWMEASGGFKKIDVRQNWENNETVNRSKDFEYDELMKILQPIQGIDLIDIYISVWVSPIKYKKNEVNPWFTAVNADYFKVEEWGVQEGREFTSFDYKNKQKVALIGTAARAKLFGSIDPIGQKIQVGTDFFEVIGILDYREFIGKGDMNNNNWIEWKNDLILVPVTTAIALNPRSKKLNRFSLITTDETITESVKAKVEKRINEEFSNKKIYTAQSNLERREEIVKSSAKFNIIFYFISAISLIVGGIVIMNIMLATIKERTREIGVRMSIGGSKLDIFLQFLIQTVLITTLGGVIGVFIGIGLSGLVADYLNVGINISSGLIVIALLMSSGVGLIFGTIPSWQACSLDPVTALRSE
ncbi:MAG: ABC transporter permease [Candidatus Cloacimonadales bacterium]